MIVEARSPPSVPSAGGRDYLSYSSVSLYQSCALRYYFRYVVDLPEKVVSASVVFGGAMHQAFDHFYNELLVGNPPPGLDVLLCTFWDAWCDLHGVEIRFNKGEGVDDIGRLADRVLRAFLASDMACPRGTIIGVEEPLRDTLIPGVPDLVGRVDLILETDDEVVVRDFKTARSAWSSEQVADSAGQLLLYHELVKPLAGDKPVRLEFAVLTKGKLPEVVIHPVQADPRQIERTKKVVERVWRAIEAESFFPSPSPLNCCTCPFRAPCRAWTG